ncbi:hypothetical protein CHARACLAT_009748, partial [Characodon lateralis]|nr:hypothetical protein [Characodon lateralis]
MDQEIKRLHSALGEDTQYKGNERFATTHNMAVTAAISQAIEDQQQYDHDIIQSLQKQTVFQKVPSRDPVSTTA